MEVGNFQLRCPGKCTWHLLTQTHCLDVYLSNVGISEQFARRCTFLGSEQSESTKAFSCSHSHAPWSSYIHIEKNIIAWKCLFIEDKVLSYTLGGKGKNWFSAIGRCGTRLHFCQCVACISSGLHPCHTMWFAIACSFIIRWSKSRRGYDIFGILDLHPFVQFQQLHLDAPAETCFLCKTPHHLGSTPFMW